MNTTQWVCVFCLFSHLRTSWLLPKSVESGYGPMHTVCRVLCRRVSHVSEKYRGTWLLNCVVRVLSLGRNYQSTFTKWLHHFYILISNKLSISSLLCQYFVFVSLSEVLETKHKASYLQSLTYIPSLMFWILSVIIAMERCLICNSRIMCDSVAIFFIFVFSLSF